MIAVPHCNEWALSVKRILSEIANLKAALQIFLATLALISIPAHAEGDARSACTPIDSLTKHPSLYSFRLENDLFNGTDSDYTSGVKFSWVSANLQDYLTDPCLPQWVRSFNQLTESIHPRKGTARNMVITAGQAMFTPQDRTSTALIPTDRPYAGWLYLGLGYNAREGQRMDSIEANIGIVGPAALARQSQNFIHDLRGIPRFNGWDNQLRNEPGIQLVAERKKKWEGPGSVNDTRLDAILHYGASLGNVATYLNAGIELRIGRIPDDFGTSPIRPAGDSNAPVSASRTRHFNEGGLHAFLSTDARIVGRDIFLDGNTFVPSHHVEKRLLVGDIAAGFAWQWPGGKIAYAHYTSSKEFDGQIAKHGFGSVTLSLEF
jgi:lipid A 3-O-deacylase